MEAIEEPIKKCVNQLRQVGGVSSKTQTATYNGSLKMHLDQVDDTVHKLDALHGSQIRRELGIQR